MKLIDSSIYGQRLSVLVWYCIVDITKRVLLCMFCEYAHTHLRFPLPPQQQQQQMAKFVKLRSADDRVFDVEPAVAKMSMTIKNMLEGVLVDMCHQCERGPGQAGRCGVGTFL